MLTLLFDVPAGWPLGGHTYVDAIGAAGIFGIVFGLSIDYAVFLLMRMREHYENGASNKEAIEFGLQRTARVITGAAAIMVAVFVAFAGADIATVSQLGIGLTVAVVLDATVVRIVLLPALMLLLGDRVWWLPRPLQRILPRDRSSRLPRGLGKRKLHRNLCIFCRGFDRGAVGARVAQRPPSVPDRRIDQGGKLVRGSRRCRCWASRSASP